MDDGCLKMMKMTKMMRKMRRMTMRGRKRKMVHQKIERMVVTGSPWMMELIVVMMTMKMMERMAMMRMIERTGKMRMMTVVTGLQMAAAAVAARNGL